MLYVVLLSCLFAFSYGQLIKPLDAVIFDVVHDADLNNDTLISIDEFTTEILNKWANGQESVNKADFVLLWTTTYGDDPAATEKFFDNMDVFWPWGVINEIDLLMQFPTIDTNGDGDVSTDEFIAFMHLKHPDGNTLTPTN